MVFMPARVAARFLFLLGSLSTWQTHMPLAKPLTTDQCNAGVLAGQEGCKTLPPATALRLNGVHPKPSAPRRRRKGRE